MDQRKFLAIGIATALLIGVLAVFFASGAPDGLESTALMIQGQKTLTGSAPADAEIHTAPEGKFSYSAPMPGYTLGGRFGPLGGIIAIAFGTLLAIALVLGTTKLVRYWRQAGRTKPEQ